MATTTKTFVFTSDTESFSGTSGPNVTLSHDASNGNPAGSLKSLLNQKNKDSASYWDLVTTWEGLGVPAGAEVTAIRLNSSNWYAGLTDWAFVDDVTCGPYELRTGDVGATLRATLWSGTLTTTQHGSWQSVGAQSDQTFTAEASTTSIRLRLNNTLDTANTNGAIVSLHEDNVSFVITYTLPAGKPSKHTFEKDAYVQLAIRR